MRTAFGVSACLCAGTGIYLGRFPRLHTIDVFLRPCRVLENLTAVDAMRLLQFSALMALLQVVMWCLFRTVRGR